MENKFLDIRRWANQRDIITGSNPKKQIIKLKEEMQELIDAIDSNDRDGIIDSIGDCTVVLTVIAAQYKLLIEECINSAYMQIKDRKGKMIDGIYVKEQDINK